MPSTTVPIRRFVPTNIDLSKFEQIEPLYMQLLQRPLTSVTEAEQWLLDASELTAAVDEYSARRYIDKSCHTDDAEIEKRFMQFVEEVEPRIKPLHFELQKKFLKAPAAVELSDGQRFVLLRKKWDADVRLFREQNVPLETEVTKKVNEYDKLSGAMTVNFDGREQTLQQMARYAEQTDRDLRERAWRTSADRRLQDRVAMDSIFDELLKLRETIAVNAGLDNFRDYQWIANKRFDYTPQQCLEFADAIEKCCVPIVKRLDKQRQDELGVPTLRPWDQAVDPKNRPPLTPFGESDVDTLLSKTTEIFTKLSPELANEFDSLRVNGNLDLGSRKGKQPGGYQSSLEESKEPFIFMNAAGLQRDVETLLHEGGHAFHYLAAKDEPLVFLRSAPMEFCEVASMSMELLGSEHLDVFYSEADTARAKRTLLEGIVRFFPWMGTIDTFQHWLYTHPNHTQPERTAQWLSILDRFGGLADWTGLEPIRQSGWQRQLHLFHYPFYYIEYGIAQLGALQLWLKAMEDPRRALANYRAALKLGGTRPLPELFDAAGIRFDFSERTLRPLMDALETELANLPV